MGSKSVFHGSLPLSQYNLKKEHKKTLQVVYRLFYTLPSNPLFHPECLFYIYVQLSSVTNIFKFQKNKNIPVERPPSCDEEFINISLLAELGACSRASIE